MLSSISLLFSLSMTLLTWIILCYFKLIEENRVVGGDIRIELDTGFENDEHLYEYNKCVEKSESRNMYYNFVWIFVCTCVLTTFTQYINRFFTKLTLLNISRHIYKKLAWSKLYPFVGQICLKRSNDLPVYQTRKLISHAENMENLCTHIIDHDNIEESCLDQSSDLVWKLSSISLPKIKIRAIITAIPQKVLILNSHIHIGQVLLEKHNININKDLNSIFINTLQRENEFLQIWSKFIQKSIDGPLLSINERAV